MTLGVESEAGLHPSHNTRTISDSSFFREHRAYALPTPAEVRAINEESVNITGRRFNRPPPVKFPSLGLGLNNQPLNDIFLSGHRDLAGPFYGVDAVRKFQNGCDIEIDEDVSVVFTHADLVPPIIIFSSGSNPVVAVVIDWCQAGWYPAYWEYCKARRVRANPKYFEDWEEEWNARYLPTILDPVDDETVYHPWLWFVLYKGIYLV
ncbi:uncharacterized protein PGRI_026860 [Penicillium griseofulvum]|uniref:Aminoglycoside phosphotransferase n=1 Tax=Penicillium patulum TaxID=5078 RepID=A0A135LIL7_PENPA|nr:uncharacterized protein PGRI_026860 [Penicillium griseofulvum]KXG48816.1 hypothetical protein PGRI_026860 [Penicillium griseofulvum]